MTDYTLPYFLPFRKSNRFSMARIIIIKALRIASQMSRSVILKYRPRTFEISDDVADYESHYETDNKIHSHFNPTILNIL